MQKFLKDFNVAKGCEFTHTSLDPYKSYYIPAESIDEFYTIYSSTFLKKIPLAITERHRDISPILIDLDFRQDSIVRRYTKDHVVSIARYILETLEEYLEILPNTEIFILEKPPRKVKDIYKDGLHIVIPDIICKPEYQHELRRLIMPQLRDLFESCGFLNSIEDIYDEAVIQRNNWFMYGSKKPDEQIPWSVSYILQWNNREIIGIPNDYTDDALIQTLSIRNKYESNTIKREVLKPIKHNDNESEISKPFTADQSTYKNEFVIVTELVNILNPIRADKYDLWFKVGCCLYNIDDSLLNLWKTFSKQSPKYNEFECDKLWRNMKNKNSNIISIGSLYYWAKEDNIDKYREIIKNNIHTLIEIAVSGTHTDIANVIYSMYNGQFVCAMYHTIWYEYVQHKWVQSEKAVAIRNIISTSVFKEFIKRASFYQNKITSSDDDQLKKYIRKVSEFNKIAQKLKTNDFKESIVKESAELFHNSEFLNKIDSNPNLIGFNNGVYDFSIHQFRSGKPDDFITISTGYDYNPKDDPEIQDYLINYVKSIMPNDEMALYLLKISAYMLHGNKYLEQIWFFTGNGRNSKGVYTSLLKKVFGELYYEPDISIVTTSKKSSSSANPELAKAKCKRLLVCSEPDDADKDAKFRVAKIKQLSGNDMIQARGLYKDCIEFKPQFGMIFQMNDKPELSKVDDAIGKRLKIINFPFQFVDHPTLDYQKKIDMTLKNRFENDVRYHQQMMLILLKTYNTYIKDNLSITEPSEVIAETSAYLEENNPVATWLPKMYQITRWTGDREKIEDVYNNYNNYFPKNPYYNKKKFGDLMSLIHIKSKVYHGIMIL
jgi:P4 family phage/plasmid primase-like protien